MEQQQFIQKTLPREIIKWMQGLDLSYSIKEPRRDLNNGFLIAEIFSRYYPTKISMHTFDNSQNQAKRLNNWNMLELFFTKNEIAIKKEEFQKVLDDLDWPQLYELVIKIYTILTQRKITKPPLAAYVNSKEFMQSEKNNQGTQSFILKDKGLEPLNNYTKKEEDPEKQDQVMENNSEKQAQLSVYSKRTNFLRVPSRPIQQTQDNFNYQIDVKNINIRPVQGNILKIKEQKLQEANNSQAQISQGHEQSIHKAPIAASNLNVNQEQKSLYNNEDKGGSGQNPTSTKKQLEKTIYEILGETITLRLQNFIEDQSKFKVVSQSNLIQAFVDQIDFFSDEFLNGFFEDILLQKEAFLNFIFKDTNDLWKFFCFMYLCAANLQPEKHSFHIIIDIINQMAEKAQQKDPLKLKSIFSEFLLPQLIQFIRASIVFEKKEKLTQTIFSFIPNDGAARHAIISQLHNQVKDMILFLQILVVLIYQENEYTDAKKQLFEDYIHYAYTNLFSHNNTSRTMALALFSHIAKLNPDLVHQKIYPKIEKICQFTWWQQKCLAISLFSFLIKGIINSAQFQALAKNPQSGQKFFSMENERIISELKNQIEKLSQSICKCVQSSSNEIVMNTTFIYISDLLSDSRTLMKEFVRLFYHCGLETRQWILNSIDDEAKDIYSYLIHSDKTIKIKTNINSKPIQQSASIILTFVVDSIKSANAETLTPAEAHIVSYCFQFTDFKVMNMESCETVANTLKDLVYQAMLEEQLVDDCLEIAKKLIELQIRAEVQIKGQEELLADVITICLKNKLQYCIQQIRKALNQLVEESQLGGNETLRLFLKDSAALLVRRITQEEISLLKGVLDPILKLLGTDEVPQQFFNQEKSISLVQPAIKESFEEDEQEEEYDPN